MKSSLILASFVFARLLSADESAAPMPGKGLAEHDFLYAGEAKERKVFMVRGGKAALIYDDPSGKGEISDAVRLSNGTILLAHQYAVKLVNADGKVLWNLDAPAGTEIHTAMPIGLDHVLFVQNGAPAMAKVVNIRTGEMQLEFELPVKNAKSTHGQFRHARLTADGRLLVAHMDMGKVCEYDAAGHELWTFAAPGVWGANPLENGNVLITSRSGVQEVNRAGEVVWSWSPTDAPELKMTSLQLAWRLPNGNTLVNSWVNSWSKPDPATPREAATQAAEFRPDKTVAWVLRSWSDPDLGPSTTIQALDEPTAPEAVSFGGIK